MLWLIVPVMIHGKPIASHESRLFPCRKNIYQGQTLMGNPGMDQEYMELLQEEIEQIYNENPDIDQELRQQPLDKDRIERKF